MNHEFYKSDKNLWRSTGIVDAFGIEHKLSPIDKQVYSYLYDRFEFFMSIGKQYFDSNKDISKELGVAEKTIARSTVFLHEVGIVDKEIRFYRNLPKNVYNKVYDFLILESGLITSKKYLGLNYGTQTEIIER